MDGRLEDYQNRWQLKNPIKLAVTTTSWVFKVDHHGSAAILKVLTPIGMRSEARGADALRYFNGKGAVELLTADPGAHLLSYIDGTPLTSLAEVGQDEACITIIAQVLRKIHSCIGVPPISFTTMAENFASLFVYVQTNSCDQMLMHGASVARDLVRSEEKCVVLHGDIHHGNILHCSRRGWLAIDPKCLVGEAVYDLANSFYNLRGDFDSVEGMFRIKRYRDSFSEALNMNAERMMQFAFVYGCLSACWNLEDGIVPKETLRIAKIIEALL